MLQTSKLKVEPVSTQVIPRDRHAQFSQLWNRVVQLKDLQLRYDVQRTEVLS